ncbi:MAG: hypothetical protein GY714_25675 [Desulfobacterales bacterium]|nr:hypothetical protein [Desulfobacterales bacterium]
MDKARSVKKPDRPLIITIISIITLIGYFVLPCIGLSYLYVKWNNPLIQSLYSEILSTIMGNLPTNYYLRTLLAFFTIVVVWGLPFYVSLSYLRMKKTGVFVCKIMCVLQIVVFFLHFMLLDELLYAYPFLKQSLVIIYCTNILILFSGLLYAKRME